ncbi:hypothetical protein ACFXKC_47835 [Streptomyces sp. NPDC059340]|uniref:hypothetical protein n=1 Tax=Streptomyces sp. NPDC059340 TaxID=3346806 RepID=UPI0036C0FD4E
MIVENAFAHVARAAAYVFTPAGRTVAATEGARTVPAREAVVLLAHGAGVTVSVDSDAVSPYEPYEPYERWHLYLPEPGGTPPRMLHEIAAILARCQESRARRRGRRRGRSAADLWAPGPGPLPGDRRRDGIATGGTGGGALTEAVAHAGPGRASVGRLTDGTAFAVVPQTEDAAGDGRSSGRLSPPASRPSRCTAVSARPPPGRRT